MIQQGQNGTAMAYQAVLKKIKSFYNGKHLILDNINNQMVMDFKVFLKEENHKKNTINFYMRIFRAIYNKAMNDGYIETGTNPFRNITFHTEVTPKRAITKAQLRQIVEIDLSDEPHLECARDIFLFSFFTRGMPFVDCAYLKKTDIRKDTIEYSRRKTDQKLSIEISPQIESIVNKYTHINNYVLPILDNNDPRSDYEQYRNALRKHNIRLQIIGDRLGIKLSSYVTRHSWATIAKNKGIPLSVISESLGHASESTTYAYLASFDKSILREANEIVTTL